MTNQKTSPIVYSIRSAVEAGGGAISRTAIYDAIRRKELTLFKRGKRSFLMADEFAAWLRRSPSERVSLNR